MDNFKCLNDLPQLCAHWVLKLHEQPLVKGHWLNHTRILKQLELPKIIANVVEHIHNATRLKAKTQDKDSKIKVLLPKLRIHEELGDHKHAYLEIWMDDKPYHLAGKETLIELYTNEIKHMQSGWIETAVEKHPTIFHRPQGDDLGDWKLFVKTGEQLLYQDILIRRLGFYFPICSQCLTCDCVYLEPRLVFDPKRPYLWVRKDSVDKIRKLFGFEI